MSVRELDCLSEVCPIPLLKAMKELKTMKAGEILILHCDHSCVAIDIEKWASDKNYPIRLIESSGGEWEVYIQKPKEK
ncbi:TusA-related sulfurtransferase [Clostridium amylolyticum]|uniref:TusA-related sulfurtransferase n=1 Tax=Clostridium amylolyticum TaxID=1121298 RepID=A0A1M6DGS6_9CLOT|nr:sulfurtransferase TusA family protein [Clostridium amylolyticum]SHI72476.1 TusA-related sulfurtransferase [Clostridium amylolyticum]